MLTPVTVLSSAARTASSESSAQTVRDREEKGLGSRALSIFLDVTVVSGTVPTLDVEVQWSHDGTTFASAQAADSFTQITAATKVAKRFDVKGSHYRLKWTIAGTTPSFTFSASALETA